MMMSQLHNTFLISASTPSVWRQGCATHTVHKTRTYFAVHAMR